MLIRLNKFLSESGVCSRREADEHILDGRVKINNKIAKLGDKIDPDNDSVTFDNIEVHASQELVYYALNKPRGIISTANDEKGRETVLDLVPETPRVYPVGRLDKESEGLLILTNDGELTNELTHPSYEHEKEYIVKIRNPKSEILNKSQIQNIQNRFINGLSIDGRVMKMKYAKIEPLNASCYMLTAILSTGYNRQIRKMCARISLEVTQLIRVRIGKLTLDSLKLSSGEYKKISLDDIK